jgi:NAD dependent epimerase/dehydratase family enzyme
VRVAHVRTGFVQSAGGGQLALQLPIYLAGLGGPLGSGRQWMPWITVDDLVGLYAHVALTPGLEGPVNASAPAPVRAKEYAATLGRVVHRPAVVPVPSIGLAVLLGREGARELALAGQRMDASLAEQWGYEFRHRDLETGLRHVLNR